MKLSPLVLTLTLASTLLTACKEENPVAVQPAAQATAPTTVPSPTPAPAAAPKPVHKPKPATAAPKTIAGNEPKSLCNDCGTITAMTAIKQEGEASGAGAVLGAIAGGLIGNQIGGGHGKEAATAAGAVAGGIGGHMAEKKIREGTGYKVTVKMDSGYTRSVTLTSEQAARYSVGSKVRVDDENRLSPR